LLGSNPQTQASANEAFHIGTFNFNAGSAGSIVEGMHISTTITISANNITLRRNKIYIVNTSASVSGARVEQNMIFGSMSVATGGSNILISNNLIANPVGIFAFDVGANTTNVSIINNTWVGVSFLFSTSSTQTATITNNIFVSTNTISLYGSSVIFSNNLIQNGTIANNSGLNISGSNNITNAVAFPFNITGTSGVVVDNLTLFGIASPNRSIDNNWLLTAVNPAKGSGTAGVDMGFTGGAGPYMLSGMPAVPSVYFFTAPGSGTTSLPNVEVREQLVEADENRVRHIVGSNILAGWFALGAT
jgi:hypothetical protein